MARDGLGNIIYQNTKGGTQVSVLWAMSLWAAAHVLATFGWGQTIWRRRGMPTRWLVGLGWLIGILGWVGIRVSDQGVRLDLGFLLLTAVAWGFLLRYGSYRAWLLAALLALFVGGLAQWIPYTSQEAQWLPIVPLEGVSWGLFAAVSVGDAGEASMTAASGAGLGLWWHHGLHQLSIGRHITAMLYFATLSAWAVGWILHRNLPLDPDERAGDNQPVLR